MAHRSKGQAGITIVELVFVLLIAGILTTIAIRMTIGTIMKAKANTEFDAVANAFFKEYNTDTERPNFGFGDWLGDSEGISAVAPTAEAPLGLLSLSSVKADSPKGTMLGEYRVIKSGTTVMVVGKYDQDRDHTYLVRIDVSPALTCSGSGTWGPEASHMDIGLTEAGIAGLGAALEVSAAEIAAGDPNLCEHLSAVDAVAITSGAMSGTEY